MDDDAIAASLLAADGSIDPLRYRLESITVGQGDATVYRVSERDRRARYLKIARGAAVASLRDEMVRTAWLAARGVRVPHMVSCDEAAGWLGVLTDGVPGSPADAGALPHLIERLAKGLAALHALPATDCPFDESTATRLRRAASAIAKEEVDPEAFDPRNRGIAPEALLARLKANPPAEDVVVVHGDATLGNILVDIKGGIGFVDCGNAGRGDRYIDLAVLADDIASHYGSEAAARFAVIYGEHRWDRVKADYYLDLYELF